MSGSSSNPAGATPGAAVEVGDARAPAPRLNRYLAPFLADAEFRAATVLLAVVFVIGLATASDYGITPDEFLFNDYGPKAAAWYASGFSDRSMFDFYDVYLYGPWCQILVFFAQSLHVADPFVTRHAVTFVVGLGGIAAVVPIGRRAAGRWAGLAAVVLCLTTGNLYGQLFFTPNDVPFMAAMTWATLAVIVMASRSIPTWPATVAAGAFTGLAIATRFGGVLSQTYLVGAMGLCAIETICRADGSARKSLVAIGIRTLAALVLGWLTAIALWPWLQIGNPFRQFKAVYDYFIISYVQFNFMAWGESVFSGALPWHYIPGQLAARLPEGFVALLVIGLVLLVYVPAQSLHELTRGMKRTDAGAVIRASLAGLAQSRALLVVVVAALGPPIFVVARGSVVFDALRHVLFVIPLLAVIAAWALVKLAPLLLRFRAVAISAAALHVVATVGTMAYLHPLEYIAMNGFAGGVAGAYGRFDLDYWSEAATVAIRRLERRLAHDAPPRFATREPRVLVCIGWREPMVGPMFWRPWTVATEPSGADFVIELERWPCGKNVPGTVIDRVERFGRTFATTIETGTDPRPGATGAGKSQHESGK
jgi:hypothetical protein